MLLVLLAMLLWTPILLAEESAAPVREKITVTPEQLLNYPFEIEDDPFSVGDLSQGQIQILNVHRRTAKDLFARKLGVDFLHRRPVCFARGIVDSLERCLVHVGTASRTFGMQD